MWDLKMYIMFLGNIYFDSDGNPTNGSTTGCHLHIGIRFDNNYVDPMSFF